MTQQTALISLKDVTKSFGTLHALDDVNLNVNRGDSLVLIGGSGSGKTLMLKCIMGLIPHDGGTIEVDGKSIATLSQADRDGFLNRFGMTFQKSGLFDSMLTWENVAFQLLQMGMDRQTAKERAIDKLASVGLEAATADLYPNELSGGMQKRVGLARAIATDPHNSIFGRTNRWPWSDYDQRDQRTYFGRGWSIGRNRCIYHIWYVEFEGDLEPGRDDLWRQNHLGRTDIGRWGF